MEPENHIANMKTTVVISLHSFSDLFIYIFNHLFYFFSFFFFG